MMLDFIHRIETAIKAKGVTFNRVEHDCGLGNGTIKRWAEQSPRLDKLVAVANYLDVSLDYLVYGTLHSDSTPNREKHLELDGYKREQGLICDGSPLDEEEADLVAMYRLLPCRSGRTSLTSFIVCTRNMPREKRTLFTGHTPPTEKKAAPSQEIAPMAEPPKFFCRFCLVLNHFLEELKKG